jgi:hypothetical protein
MTALTHSSALVLSFWRDEQELHRLFCRDGREAASFVIDLMIEIGEMQRGDRLTVAEPPETLPEVSRSGHYS